MESDAKPLINHNSLVQTYYNSFVSRIAYAYFTGGAIHFGYWEHDTCWPFPISRAMRAMEDKVAESLALPAGARLLDAGCGGGNQSIHLARKHGYRILAIDIVEYHIDETRRRIAKAKLSTGQVEAHVMDYHHLETLESESFDGVYTLQTLIHASDVTAVLREFYRLLVPGGRIALFEHNQEFVLDSAKVLRMTKKSGSPGEKPQPIVLKSMLEDIGFTDVVVRDYTANITPLFRFLCAVAYIPYLIISLLGLEPYFVNIVAVVAAYRHRDMWQYIDISATKPGGPIEAAKTR